MYMTIQALVLRVTDYNDRDALLTVLTRRHGKLTIKARGLRRKNSPLTAPCQLLAYGEFTLFEYRGMYTINEAVSLELFQNLRRDLQKLALGTYFAQAAETLSQEDLPNPELLSLLLNCLHALSQLRLPEAQIKAVFELRAACLAGYTPDLTGCCICGAQNPERFDISAGRLECAIHRSPDSSGIRMPLSPGALEAMRFIVFCDARRLFSFRVGRESLEQLGQVTESYLATQLERGFSTLDFYKSLLI
ncbi:MAG TPA: DNA repair protein RecO [Candidatus Faecousia intestinigallinarum]|nr:DNA repair protein RecO [Candidatus Faecousia intestinigallinarum]